MEVANTTRRALVVLAVLAVVGLVAVASTIDDWQFFAKLGVYDYFYLGDGTAKSNCVTFDVSGTDHTLCYEPDLGNINADNGIVPSAPFAWAGTSGTKDLLEVYKTDWPPTAAISAQAYLVAAPYLQAYAMGGYNLNVGMPAVQIAMNATKSLAFTAFMYGQLNALGQGLCSTTTSTVCWADSDCPGGEHCDNGVAAIYEGGLQAKPEGNPPTTCSTGTTGLFYYDSDNGGYCFCNGSSWTQVDDWSTSCS